MASIEDCEDATGALGGGGGVPTRRRPALRPPADLGGELDLLTGGCS